MEMEMEVKMDVEGDEERVLCFESVGLDGMPKVR